MVYVTLEDDGSISSPITPGVSINKRKAEEALLAYNVIVRETTLCWVDSSSNDEFFISRAFLPCDKDKTAGFILDAQWIKNNDGSRTYSWSASVTREHGLDYDYPQPSSVLFLVRRDKMDYPTQDVPRVEAELLLKSMLYHCIHLLR